MITTNLILNNFSEPQDFLNFFDSFSDDCEYTTREVFRRKTPPACSICSTPMAHNGHNTYTKKDLGKIKIGRYKCSNCGSTHEENYSFWKHLKTLLFDSFNNFYQILRYHNVSYGGISDIMAFIHPRSKSTIFRAFNKKMEPENVPISGNSRIVHYDEQHPRRTVSEIPFNLIGCKNSKSNGR